MRVAPDEPAWEKLGQCHNLHKQNVVSVTSLQFVSAASCSPSTAGIVFVALTTPMSLQQAIPKEILEWFLCNLVSDLSN